MMTAEWNVSRERWEALLAQAGRSALVQDWSYGEAKRLTEGWSPCRAVLRRAGAPVAVAQVLEKRLGGVVRVARLNRGPVWLVEPSDDLAAEALAILRRSWRWWRLGALFLAPELPEDKAGFVGSLGFRPRRAPAWGSAWIDLAQPAETLRKRLDGKWRNMLSGAEKAGLTLDVSEGGAALDWLMDRYRELIRDKSFSGIPPALIAAMATGGARLLVLRALAEGEAVGGILLVRHGDAATYLIGWNGERGRKLKANNFLLWRGVLELQARGCRWFDLGGIDEVLTPGIAAFKRGMNGEEFRLAGEFLGL